MISQEEYIFLDSFFERNQLNSEYSVFRSENSASFEEFINSFIESYYFNKQIDFPVFFQKVLKENEKEFLDFLIDNFQIGLKSDIYNKLIENNYPLLVECIQERKILFEALKRQERENLRTRFNQIDENEANFLHENDIKIALSKIERQNLKSHFEEIDQIELENRAATKNNSIYLRLVKYAAILILMVLPAYLTINLFDDNKPKISKKPHQSKPKNELIDSLILDSIPSFELKEETYFADLKVIKEQSFGFVQKEETIRLKINCLNERYVIMKIEDLQVTLNDLQNKYDASISGKVGREPINADYQSKIKELQVKIDQAEIELKKYNNSYLFDVENKNCKLFLNQNFISKDINKFEILKLENGSASSEYYLKVKTSYFSLTPSKQLKQLSYFSDEEIITKLEEIE